MGGALCVSPVRYSAADLQEIQNALMNLDGMLGVGSGRDRVDLTVVFDDGALQDRLDEEYGEGVVRVTSVLQPYRNDLLASGPAQLFGSRVSEMLLMQ